MCFSYEVDKCLLTSDKYSLGNLIFHLYLFNVMLQYKIYFIVWNIHPNAYVLIRINRSKIIRIDYYYYYYYQFTRKL